MFWISELVHLMFSLLIGFIAWKLWKKPALAFTSAILSGFLIDADHLIDWFFEFGFLFSLAGFIRGDQFASSDKLFILLHGWEYAIIIIVAFLVVASKSGFAKTKTILFALGASLILHLGADSTMNDGLSFRSYSLIQRAKNNFDIEKLVTPEHWEKHKQQELINQK